MFQTTNQLETLTWQVEQKTPVSLLRPDNAGKADLSMAPLTLRATIAALDEEFILRINQPAVGHPPIPVANVMAKGGHEGFS